MGEEKKQKIEKDRNRMELVNKFRLVFIFVAFMLLLFIFWGGKAWEQQQWFADTRQKLYNFLWYDIVLLFVTTFAKLFAAVRYNSAVRKI